jgi:hypothetical protein
LGKNQQQLLQMAIDQSLRSLGEPIMKTIVWHMNHRGFFLKSGNIDIKLFHQVLKSHYPNVSDTRIVQNKNMLDYVSDKHHPSSADAVIQQIQNLLEAEMGDGK